MKNFVCIKVYILIFVDEAKSVLHFKLRVLDLVELYIRKESTNPLVLVGHMITIIIIINNLHCHPHPTPPPLYKFQDLVVPLYELIHAAQSHKESSPLVKRASGIFKNRLCHLKEVTNRYHDYQNYAFQAFIV
jgi:hypothetical protein